MTSHAEIDELSAKRLCHHCVGEKYLRAEMRKEGRRKRCSYCERTAKSYTIGELADRIEEAFETHYVRTSDQPDSWQITMLSDKESDYDWERDGEPVLYTISNAEMIDEEPAQDILTILEERHSDFDCDAMGEETEFSSDSHYVERSTTDEAWQEEWSGFERSLKLEARFFSRSAADYLTNVFSGISDMTATDGRPVVVDAGPSTDLDAIFRARAFQSDDKLIAALCRPDQQLGSPPAALVASGRMNARGISVFYGASDPSAAIAEVRPPVGSQVAVARFAITRPVRLLDLTALGDVAEGGSVFDDRLAGRLGRAMFLRSLGQRITRPVMPDDESFEYLPTQAIADFLATENEPPIDGIVFPSVQAAGDVLNVVLFHKVARVASIELPDGTEIEARTGQMYEEGWETEYSVFERVPRPQTPADNEEAESAWPSIFPMAGGLWVPPDPDYRDPALRIDLESVRVHQVRRVEVETWYTA
jgi:hypothetical protein